MFHITVALVTLTSLLLGQHTVADSDVLELPFCKPNAEHIKNPIFVTTADGIFTALNAEDGQQLWNVTTEPGDMLSSSISNLEYMYGGQIVRLVPSLSGTLYKFDGRNIEGLDFTADMMLQSSFHISEETMITGGRETSSYGINIETGKVRYVCEMSGCRNESQETGNDNLLILRRNTQTVRAIEPLTGTERWNFSVGQHEVTFLSSECSKSEPISTDIEFQVAVAEGQIFGMKKSTHDILWTYEFNSPIVHVWEMHNGKVKELDIVNQGGDMATAAYMGMYNNFLYLQESRNDKVVYKKLVATVASEENSLLTYKENENSALSVIHDLDILASKHGAYFYNPEEYPDNETADTCSKDHHPVEHDTSLEVPVLYHWWKELTTVLILCTIINAYILKKYLIKANEAERTQMEYHNPSTPPATGTAHYSSNYVTEKCLGAGGFGVVFQVRNKMDLKSYAVKRMALPLEEKAQDKVLREVRALSRLDHPNIVRYYYCWSESQAIDTVKEHDSPFIEEIARYRGTSADFGTSTCDESAMKTSELQGDLTDLSYNNSSIFTESKNLQKNDSLRAAFPKEENAEESDSDNSIVFDSSANAPHDTGMRANGGLLCRSSLSSDSDDSIVFKNSTDSESDEAIHYKNDPEVLFCRPPLSNGSDNSIVFENSVNVSQERGNSSPDPKSLFFKPSSGGDSNRGSGDGSFSTDNISECDIHNDVKLQSNGFEDPFRVENFCIRKRLLPSKKEMSRSDKDAQKKEEMPSKRLYLYIQMELCSESLKNWLVNNQSRSHDQILKMFNQIVKAVEYIHSKQLIHRDLKPANIFISSEGQIKVGDFGLVTDANSGSHGLSKLQLRSNAVGTMPYMSPEQMNNCAYNHKIDIFALGLIFFEMFEPMVTDSERCRKLGEAKQYLFPDNFSISYPEEKSLLMKLLSKDPQKRPTTYGIRASAVFRHLQEDYDLIPRDKYFTL